MAEKTGGNIVSLDFSRRVKPEGSAPPKTLMAFTTQELEQIHQAFEKGRQQGVLSHYQVTNGDRRARVEMYAVRDASPAVITVFKSRSGKFYGYGCEICAFAVREVVDAGPNFGPLMATLRHYIDRLIDSSGAPRPRRPHP